MTQTKLPSILSLFILIFYGCNDDLSNLEKYQRPEWLAGKVYSQILEIPELSEFAKCLDLTGYDTLINVSGSYTVFAPNNDAIAAYLQGRPESSVEEIPLSDLTRLVRNHIVQNPWSKLQLMSLDVHGWIDSTDISNDKPRGFKRESLLLDKDSKYGVEEVRRLKKFIIVDTLETGWWRRAITDSRKYIPIFFKGYLDIYDLSPSDFEFYFGRSIDSPDDIYFAGAKVIGNEIFAENGFVYNIDRVVDPLLNAYQLISRKDGGYRYDRFRDLVNQFPLFEYNDEKTFDQPGADQGQVVDSLFDLSFPRLTFDLTSERTSPPSGTFGLPGNVTIRYHHGLIAPTDDAIDAFEEEFLSGSKKWGSMEDAPENIKRIIANTHLSINPIYPSDMKSGFYNGELDIVRLDEADIVEKKFGSNSTFIGTKEAVVPRAFKAVTGPVYLQKGYSTVMNAIETAGLLPALKREGQDYMFFVESDANCKIDSSLLYESFSERFSAFIISPNSRQGVSINKDDLRTLLLNHIGVQQARGVARKEFIKNLAGNYLIVNNETGEVKGTAPTSQGYKGFRYVNVIPNRLDEGADNGSTWDIEDWFSFSSATIYLKIFTDFPHFHKLLLKAGLANEREYRYTFLSESENYTIFIPTQQALTEFQSDTLTAGELVSLLKLHFIQRSLIFTDGNAASGYYETTREDVSSSSFSKKYTKIFIETGIDVINIPGKPGTGIYVSIPESSSSNILTGRNLGQGTEVFPKMVNNGVIHVTEKVLTVGSIDSE